MTTIPSEQFCSPPGGEAKCDYFQDNTCTHNIAKNISGQRTCCAAICNGEKGCMFPGQFVSQQNIQRLYNLGCAYTLGRDEKVRISHEALLDALSIIKMANGNNKPVAKVS